MKEACLLEITYLGQAYIPQIHKVHVELTAYIYNTVHIIKQQDWQNIFYGHSNE